MIVDLNRQDLLNLVRSRVPKGGYIGAEEANKKGWGILNGFPNEKWNWSSNYLATLSDKQLYVLYLDELEQ